MAGPSRLQQLLNHKQRYAKVEGSDDLENNLNCQRRVQANYPTALSISVILNVLTLSAVLFSVVRRTEQFADGNTLLRKTSSYSPVFDHLTIKSREVLFNGTFLDESIPPSPFRLLPGPEVDAAWNKISNPTYGVFSKSEIAPLGHDSSTLARVPESWGYGPESYLAEFDLSHQLHCLNMLRKASFPEHYTMPRSKVYQDQHKMHCIDMLRQNILCSATVDLIPYVWYQGEADPQPDFSIKKQCRNSDVVLDWMNDEKLDALMTDRWWKKMPEDVKPVSLPPKLYQWLKDLERVEGEENVDVHSKAN